MNRIEYDAIKFRAENGTATSQDCLDLIRHFDIGDSSSGLTDEQIEKALSFAYDYETHISYSVTAFKDAIKRSKIL